MNEIHYCKATLEHRLFRSDQAHFGKGVFAFKMDAKEALCWYDRLIALFFGVQWTKLTIQVSPELPPKTIYVRIYQIAKFLHESSSTIAKLGEEELAKKFYEAKKALKEPAINASPIVRAPLLILAEIFFGFDLPELAEIALVCKRFSAVLNKGGVWKRVIYRELAFNKDKWAEYVGEEAVAQENQDREFEALPKHIVDEYRKFHRAFPQIKHKDGLVLVRLPKTLNGGLTLNNLGQFEYFTYDSEAALRDKSIEESYWVLMIKFLLPGTLGKSYAEQQTHVARLAQKGLFGYESPEALEVAICMIANKFEGNTHFFNNKFHLTHCKENIGGLQSSVGGKVGTGLMVYAVTQVKGNASIGLTARRKFTAKLKPLNY